MIQTRITIQNRITIQTRFFPFFRPHPFSKYEGISNFDRHNTLTPHSPPKKKTIIRAPQRSSNMNTGFEMCWEVLGGAISEIYGASASILSFEELYRSSYNLILRKHGEKLYVAVTALVTNLLTAKRRIHSTALQLESLCVQWEHHVTCLLMFRDILMYLDRLHAPEANVPLVYDLGLELFRDIIFYPLKIHLASQCLEM